MDNLFLTGPAGTQWNIGSWLDKTAPIDYGAQGLVRQQLSQTTFVEGAQFAYETAAGPRRMVFPLIVPSGGVAGLSLDAIEASLRQMVRPNAVLDIQPQGVATAEIVRFDVLGGDVGHRNYSVDLQRNARRRYTLSLLTEPFGYWPTWITLATGASFAPVPGLSQPVKAASIVGDAPAFVRFIVRNTVAGLGIGSAQMDGIVWSLGRPAIPTMVYVASYYTSAAPVPGMGISTDLSASFIGGQAIRGSNLTFTTFGAAPSPGGGFPLTSPFMLGAYVTNDFVGRHRVFAFARMGGGNAQSLRMIADVTPDGIQPVATGNPVATIVPVGSMQGASVYGIYDLGQISLPFPPEASAYPSWSNYIRVTVAGASDGSNATTNLDFGGIYLLPVDGPAGYLTRGLTVPSTNATPISSRQSHSPFFDSSIRMLGFRVQSDSNLDVGTTPGVSLAAPLRSGLGNYRGGFPYVGGSDMTLRVLQLDRLAGGSVLANADPPIRMWPSNLGFSLTYRPRFQFLKGI